MFMFVKGHLNAKLSVIMALLLLSGSSSLKAEEGMWIPLLIEKFQMGVLKEAGLRLNAEEIYSVNQDCLKDAIVIFGRGCTGEMISEDGLLLTNHHCGESSIQFHSSVEHDYLTHGYWAMNRDEELPDQRLSVTFLRYIEEVSSRVTEGLTQGMTDQVKDRLIRENKGKIIRNATSGTNLDAEVESFYSGNAYYLFVYEVFRDVRLVGAPPLSIGNFGGDLDNWIWPRHTGDFSLFRVYTDHENRASVYHPSNIPYKPRKHLEIDAGGIMEGDFTMILGYPGSTNRYLYSDAVRLMLEKSLPLKVQVRTSRMEIMDRYMRSSDQARIQYTTKYRAVTNSWKKWKGMIQGLCRNDVVEKKIDEEERFMGWVNNEGERQLKYDAVLENFALYYADLEFYSTAIDLKDEAIDPIELFQLASRLNRMMRQGLSVEAVRSQAESFYKNFYLPIDREIFGAMMAIFQANLPESLLPPFLADIRKKYRDNYTDFAAKTYRKTLFRNVDGVQKLLDLYKKDPQRAILKLMTDPVTVCLSQFNELYRISIYPVYYSIRSELERNYMRYMAALLEMSNDRFLYPDANFTMRLSYGFIKGFQPQDGIEYQYWTTLEGIIEKSISDPEEYPVPEKLVELYQKKDFGRFSENGTMPVCFVASNHTTGGNSGSPVLDADGQLIGLNFDRNWEGTMSDIYYDPSLCRNISVDIRYVLFIIDKFAGAGYLLDEMDILW